MRDPLATEGVAPKAFLSGTHRSRTPRETFDDYKRWMPGMGITRVANLTGLDTIGLPVFAAIRPNARSLSTSQGKGIDEASARTSALMESIEFWHAEHLDEVLLRWETSARLRRGARVVDLARIPSSGAVRYDVPLLWAEGFCLLARAPTWVPFDLVSQADLAVGGVPATPFAMSSTGLASGNHILEAIAHALCEIIERHCELAWTQEERSRRIDPASCSGGMARAVLEKIDRAGARAAIWECTDPTMGVPAFQCEVMDPPDRGRRRLLGAYGGSGCHLSADVALVRALTEAVQSRLTFIAGSRDDLFRSHYGSTQNDAVHALKWRSLVEETELHPFAPVSLAAATFDRDVTTLLSAVTQAGAEQVVVVDLTRSEMQIPVVKVVVPGLREVGAPGSPAGSP